MNKKPWIKEDRRVKAENHVKEMNETFSKEIQYSIENSTVYHDAVSTEYDNGNVPECKTIPLTTELAVSKHCSGKTAVLNFATACFSMMRQERLNAAKRKRQRNLYFRNPKKLKNSLTVMLSVRTTQKKPLQ